MPSRIRPFYLPQAAACRSISPFFNALRQVHGLNALTSFALRFPRATVALGALVALAAAPGMLRLTLRTDGHALVPADAPQVKYDLEVREKFDLKDPLVILIESPDSAGIFNLHTLQLIEDLTRALEKLEGLKPQDVFSLATEKNDRVWPGTLKFRRFLEPMPATPQEIARLRQDLRELAIYSGTLVSKDEKSAAVMVGVPRGANRLRFLAEVRELVRGYAGPETIHIIGAPVAEALLGTHILEDLGVPRSYLGTTTYADGKVPSRPANLNETRVWIARTIGLVPLAVALMGVVFLISFRSLAAAAMPLMEVAACLVFVFGLMGWLGIPIYLTTAVLPIILTGTGVTDEVHVFSRFFHLLRADAGQDSAVAVRTTMQELTRPIVMTSVTTGIGFLSFAFSSIEPVQAFGVFASIGMVFCMVWTLTVVPASFVLLAPKRFIRPEPVGKGRAALLSRMFHVFGRLVIKLRYVVLAIAVGGVALAPLGVRNLFVQDSWIDGFAPESEFFKATTAFNEQFLGMHVLQVIVKAGGVSFRGEVSAKDLGDREVRLPSALVGAGDSFNSWRLRLQRIGTPAAPDAGGFKPQEEYEWWVDSARADGEQVVLTLQMGRPSPVRILGLASESQAAFELSSAPLMQPHVLRRIADLEKFIEGRTADAVGGVLGPAEYVATTNFMIMGRRAGERRIPKDVPQLERVWREYKNVRGKERLYQLVDSSLREGVITILLRNANFVATARLMDAIREYENGALNREATPAGREMPPLTSADSPKISLSFAGDVAVSQTLIGAIVTTQVQSVLGSLLGILLVTVILGRSLWFGILCVIPCGIAVLMNFAAMGWFSIPLGVATSMFASMALGIGVDYAIHLQSHFRRLQESGQSRRGAVIQAIAATGPAIFIDTLAVGVGFGILTLSQVPANARLGGLVALSIGTCFVATIVVLPALLGLRETPPAVSDAIASEA